MVCIKNKTTHQHVIRRRSQKSLPRSTCCFTGLTSHSCQRVGINSKAFEPSRPSLRLCSSSTKKRRFSQPRPISETQVQAGLRPTGAWEQAELASPLPRSPPGTGEGKRKPGLALLWPLGWALVGVGLPLGSPSSPLLPRAPGTVTGPDIRFSYTPFSTPPAPLGLRGAFRAVL